MSLFKVKNPTIFNKGVNLSLLDDDYKAPRNHGENTEIINTYVLNIDPDTNIVENAESKGEENYEQYIQNEKDSNVEIIKIQ